MRKIIVLLLISFILVGFSSANHFFDVNGNLKDEYATEMKSSWCEYNADRDFAKNECH